jgi:glycosyltransferase involved in cell wall biosynthesis
LNNLETTSFPDSFVSIVIPAFNSSKTLAYALPSVLSQERSLIREIVVVDSSDDGLMSGIIAEFEPKGVRFINSGTRVMPAIQRNIGARASSGDMILFLDSDVILEPDYVAKIAGYFRQGRKAGFGSVTIPDFQMRKVAVVAQYYLQLNEYLPSGKPRQKPFILGCSNFVDRADFEKIGGYPEIRAAEDVLYGFRLNRVCPIWFLPDASVAHIFREDWKGFFRNQELLGKYVARYRKEESGGIAFRGIMPILLFPVFLAVKWLRIAPRIAAAGIRHSLRSFAVAPAFFLGLLHWGKGFVREAIGAEKKEREG